MILTPPTCPACGRTILECSQSGNIVHYNCACGASMQFVVTTQDSEGTFLGGTFGQKPAEKPSLDQLREQVIRAVNDAMYEANPREGWRSDEIKEKIATMFEEYEKGNHGF